MGCIARSKSENNFIASLVPYQTLIPPGTRETGGTTMTKLHILWLPALVLVMLAPDAMAQRRGGGAVSGGVRGAMVGGLVGGSEGAETGAKVGAVAGASRAAVDREAQRRAQYQTSAEYQNAPHSDFNTVPPQVLVSTPPASATAPPAATAPAAAASGEEAVIRKDGMPVIGITYPSDWKQITGDRYVSAVSADGQAYSMIATLEGAADNQAGIAKVKQGLENYLQDIKYDNLTKTKRGALVLTGTGKGKKSGVAVVFAAGVFDTGAGKLAGAAFLVDARIEEHYQETVRQICQTIRVANQFVEKK
jgi:uncharacterized protein YcfJ